MFLKEIQLVNFKNYGNVTYKFSPKVNCIAGLNGTGKTNLLDAIHYLSMTKGYFNHAEQLSIRHEADFFAIHGDFILDNIEGTNKVSCIQQRDKRKIVKVNQKEYDRLSEHIGNYPSVMISPYDTDYINGNSDVRRRYFDSVISQFDKIYLDSLIQYNRVLAHRNALLKYFNEKQSFNEHEMSIWNDRMIDLGQKIFQIRKQFLEGFLPVFNRIFSLISSHETVSIDYKSHLQEGDFATLLKATQQKDYAAQYSTVGTHKDDFLFTMDTYPVKRFCSQGQQKTFLIVIKLAQFEYIKQLKGQKPLLLLDDVFDKLDEIRVNQLVSLVISDDYGQVFITDTHKDRMLELLKNKDVHYNLIEIQ
ncbi:MAG: DNA replication and repair protein RecF [Bacteroidales bacterium]|jgi:DNA replication and repair protein RecF|nr:DNA replication and repair protein RecF [Bacteroidales bacterium]